MGKAPASFLKTPETEFYWQPPVDVKDIGRAKANAYSTPLLAWRVFDFWPKWG